MYKNSAVILIIGKIDTSIPFKMGFNKGNRIYPVLFLFLIMKFSDML